VGGLGAGIYDGLVEQGYGGSFGSGKLNAINFGSKPIGPPALDDTGKASGGPANRRAEMAALPAAQIKLATVSRRTRKPRKALQPARVPRAGAHRNRLMVPPNPLTNIENCR